LSLLTVETCQCRPERRPAPLQRRLQPVAVLYHIQRGHYQGFHGKKRSTKQYIGPTQEHQKAPFAPYPSRSALPPCTVPGNVSAKDTQWSLPEFWISFQILLTGTLKSSGCGVPSSTKWTLIHIPGGRNAAWLYSSARKGVLPTAWLLLAATAFHCVYCAATQTLWQRGYPGYQLFSVVLPGNQAFHLPFGLFFNCGNYCFFD